MRVLTSIKPQGNHIEITLVRKRNDNPQIQEFSFDLTDFLIRYHSGRREERAREREGGELGESAPDQFSEVSLAVFFPVFFRPHTFLFRYTLLSLSREEGRRHGPYAAPVPLCRRLAVHAERKRPASSAGTAHGACGAREAGGRRGALPRRRRERAVAEPASCAFVGIGHFSPLSPLPSPGSQCCDT